MARMGKGQSSTELTQVEKSRGFCRVAVGGKGTEGPIELAWVGEMRRIPLGWL